MEELSVRCKGLVDFGRNVIRLRNAGGESIVMAAEVHGKERNKTNETKRESINEKDTEHMAGPNDVELIAREFLHLESLIVPTSEKIGTEMEHGTAYDNKREMRESNGNIIESKSNERYINSQEEKEGIAVERRSKGVDEQVGLDDKEDGSTLVSEEPVLASQQEQHQRDDGGESKVCEIENREGRSSIVMNTEKKKHGSCWWHHQILHLDASCNGVDFPAERNNDDISPFYVYNGKISNELLSPTHVNIEGGTPMKIEGIDPSWFFDSPTIKVHINKMYICFRSID